MIEIRPWVFIFVPLGLAVLLGAIVLTGCSNEAPAPAVAPPAEASPPARHPMTAIPSPTRIEALATPGATPLGDGEFPQIAVGIVGEDNVAVRDSSGAAVSTRLRGERIPVYAVVDRLADLPDSLGQWCRVNIDPPRWIACQDLVGDDDVDSSEIDLPVVSSNSSESE